MLQAKPSEPKYNIKQESKEDHLITDLPGTSSFDIPFKQYSGKINVDEKLEKSLFYWFVESMRSPSSDPLLIWLNGGPGSSSIAYGFFTEHGPFRPNKDGKTLKPNFDFSWNKIANVIYLESPAGVGFSSSGTEEGLNADDPTTAENTLSFLLKFFEMYPEFKGNDFYVSGESYGGHYVPQLSNLILEHNKKSSQISSEPGMDIINMKGFLVGNPGLDDDWYFNTNEYAFVTTMYNHGLIPQAAYTGAYHACDWQNFLTNCASNYTNPSKACEIETGKALKYLPRDYDPYDVYAPTCKENKEFSIMKYENGYNYFKNNSPGLYRMLNEKYNLDFGFDPCLERYVVSYLNQIEVQKAIHIPDAPVKWTPGGGIHYGDESEIITPYFEKFFKETDWKMMVFTGDTDAAVPLVGTQRWVECLKLDTKQDWKQWYLDDKVGGAFKIYDKGLIYLTVHGCGHTIPTYCPHQGFEMFDMFFSL